MRHVRLGRTGLSDALAAMEQPRDAGIEAWLDEVTREHRWGDDPR